MYNALLIVDVQNDFCEGGALAVPGAEKVISPLNHLISRTMQSRDCVLASRDWHPHVHPSFARFGGEWPVHCVQDTEGAKFHEALLLPPETIVVSKGTRFDKDQYSAFDQTGLAAYLQKEGVGRITVGGLALDVCVLQTALDAKTHGFEVTVVLEAASPLSVRSGQESVQKLKSEGVRVAEDAGSASF